MIVKTLISSLLVVLLSVLCEAHVELVYPPARRYALDFLDNVRTAAPCGMARGRRPVTDLEAGSTFVVSWYTGYAHDGGFRIELFDYHSNGDVNMTYNLTSPAGGYVGAHNITMSSYEVTLPAEVTECNNCTLRLIRQALNWGPNFLFWSCADINIVPEANYTRQCSSKGSYDTTDKICRCSNTYSGSDCQFHDECVTDSDCGEHGQCKDITDFSFPQKQCFCEPGWFGLKCNKESAVKSVEFDESQYQKRTWRPNKPVHLYYRILKSSNELEIVLRAKTTSYVAIGWKPNNFKCTPYSLRPSGKPEPEPEGTRDSTPEPEGTKAPQPETTKVQSEPEPTKAPTAEPEPEPEGPGDTNSMDCSDIVIGAAVGRYSRIRDYYTSDRSTPRQDEFYGGSQSLTAAVGQETDDGTTTIIFRRPLQATESTDHSIEDALMSVIWSHGQTQADTPNVGHFYRPDEIKYHADNRGKTRLNFHDGDDDDADEGSWSTPKGCTGSTCQYRAVWSLDPSSDLITFTITARQPSNTWTGVAFASQKAMENMDVNLGWVDSSGRGVTMDGRNVGRYSKPTRDTTENLQNQRVTYANGLLTFTFQRLRDTGDSNDLAFTDDDCYYFLFPVGGGSHTNSDFGRHSSTPIISADKICIKSSASTLSALSLTLFAVMAVVFMLI